LPSLLVSPFSLFFHDTAPTEIYTLSLHDALPICAAVGGLDKCEACLEGVAVEAGGGERDGGPGCPAVDGGGESHAVQRVRGIARSEEHTSELQSLTNLVCRLLLEKKKRTNSINSP